MHTHHSQIINIPRQVVYGQQYHRGNNLRGLFFGRAKIGGRGLELVLRNEGNFWYKVVKIS